jgi:hypothetical protein
MHCLPGGRATDVKANLKRVLAKAKTGEHIEHRDIVIHIGTKDVRMKQSEVTKRNIASASSLVIDCRSQHTKHRGVLAF